MRRGVSSGGGQSSLNYLFGSGEAPAPKPAAANNAAANSDAGQPAKDAPSAKPAPNAQPAVPAGANRPTTNNYFRADGQNTGNFLTDRPSTKVHAAPGGGSSLGYLFGGGSN